MGGATTRPGAVAIHVLRLLMHMVLHVSGSVDAGRRRAIADAILGDGRKREREERIAAGLEERTGMGDRIRAMQRASRGRMARFQGQLHLLALRKRHTHTSTEAAAAATELGMTLEEVQELEKEAREHRLGRRILRAGSRMRRKGKRTKQT